VTELHVLTLIDSLGLGGAEMLLAELATGAASADLRLSVGYLRARDGNPAEARLRTLGVEPQQVPITGLIAPRSVASVRRHIAAVAPDVVHTHLGLQRLPGRPCRTQSRTSRSCRRSTWRTGTLRMAFVTG
jgi:hypothetical protein